METTENKEVMTSRDRLKSRISKRYPDRALTGQDGRDAQDVIDDSLEEMLGEYDARQEAYTSHSKRLNDLFASDARIGGLFMKWAEGGNILEHLIEEFGEEFIDALGSEEGKQKFLEAQNRWLDKVSRNKAADEEAQANFKKSMETLDAFQQEHNLTDEQAIAVFDKIHQIGVDMVKGIYTAENFQLALNAINHDSDVASARAQGELAGRNSKIKEQMRSGENIGNLPPSLGGQGSGIRETKPKAKRRTALDTFGLND